MVAVYAIDATLRGVGKDVFVQGGLADALGDIVFFRKRLAGGFILYEFDAEEQAQSTNVAHMWMRLQHG